ncbi:MAG: hypothetical protein V4675_04220 [Verrucomicrobiota bacterium]
MKPRFSRIILILSVPAILLLGVMGIGSCSWHPHLEPKEHYAYSHAETTGNPDYLESASGNHFEIEFSPDSNAEAVTALQSLDLRELSSPDTDEAPEIRLQGSLSKSMHRSHYGEPAYFFRLDDWAIQVPLRFIDLSTYLTVEQEVSGQRRLSPRLISSLDDAPRSYRFAGRDQSYKRFESRAHPPERGGYPAPCRTGFQGCQ